MTRLPRDVCGTMLVRALAHLGYQVTRQTGSHIRMTARRLSGEHHITIPNHDPIKIGTLNAILKDIAAHLGIEREQLLQKLGL